MPLFTQARRRTTTQMELLYANSCEPDAPSGEFSSPLQPMAETPEGGTDESLSSTLRDYMLPAAALSSRMGGM